MRNFKIGDRVRVTHYGKEELTENSYVGQVGTISMLPRTKWNYYRVALDNDPSDMKWYADLPVREDEIQHVDGE